MRTALLYGMWATFCFALLSFVVFATTDVGRGHVGRLMAESLPIVIAVFVVATLAWLVWHREGRKPSLLGLGMMALAVTLIVHVFFVALLLDFDLSGGTANFAATVLYGLMFHGWFTFPIALGATAIFAQAVKRPLAI